MEIIDSHIHIYPDAIALKAAESIGKYYQVGMRYDGTVATLRSIMQNAGITGGLVHSVATSPKQISSINRFIASVVDENPCFVGFATLHPDSDNLPAEIAEAKALGLKGIKLHPDCQHFLIDGDRSLAMLELLEGDLPVLVHAGDYRTEYSKPRRILNVLRTFPKLKMIAAHLGGWSEWGHCAKELSQTGVYVDTSSSSFMLSPELRRALMEIYGLDRVLFGSDYPMWNAGEELELLKEILSPQEQEKVFHENFYRFMKEAGQEL